MKFYAFSITGTLIFLFINLYCYKSLSKNTATKPYKTIFLIIFASIFVFEIIYFFSFGLYNISLLFYQAGIFCMGISFMTFSILVIYDIFGVLVFKFNKTRRKKNNIVFAKFDQICSNLFGASKFSRSRRKTLKFLLDIGILIGIFGYILKGIYNANLSLYTTKRQVKIKNLTKPLKIAIISDIHIGEFLKKDFIDKIVAKINKMQPDGVFIVGDLADLSGEKLGDILEPLEKLNAKAFFVSGNHEYYSGFDGIIQKVENLGIEVLENKSVEFEGVNLVGVNDIAGFRMGHHEPDFTKALSNLNPNLPTILLSHQPKSINFISPNLLQNIDLMICGHTHGGQIFPFGFFVWLDQKYTYGLYKITQKLQMLVTSGAGFWGPPMRIFSKSEIVELELNGE